MLTAFIPLLCSWSTPLCVHGQMQRWKPTECSGRFMCTARACPNHAPPLMKPHFQASIIRLSALRLLSRIVPWAAAPAYSSSCAASSSCAFTCYSFMVLLVQSTCWVR